MNIREAGKKDKEESLKIAKELKKWFTKEAIENIKIDFKINNLVVALEKNKVVGFLCYNSYEGVIKLMWMGVKGGFQRKEIGTGLLKWLEDKSKKIGSKVIEIETLPESEKYKPYEITRAFYKKHGFKKLYIKKPRKKGWDPQVVLEKQLI